MRSNALQWSANGFSFWDKAPIGNKAYLLIFSRTLCKKRQITACVMRMSFNWFNNKSYLHKISVQHANFQIKFLAQYPSWFSLSHSCRHRELWVHAGVYAVHPGGAGAHHHHHRDRAAPVRPVLEADEDADVADTGQRRRDCRCWLAKQGCWNEWWIHWRKNGYVKFSLHLASHVSCGSVGWLIFYSLSCN